MKLLKLNFAVFCLAAITSWSVHATSIWVSDSTNGSESFLYELDYATGAVLNTINGPGVFADALSFSNDGQSIFVLDSSTDSDVYQIDLAGNVLNSFSIALDAEGLTILADGSLIIGGGTSGVIATVDAGTGAILSSFSSAANIFGLASDGLGTLFGLRIDGTIDSYDLAGNLLGSLNTGATGITLGLAYTGTSFLISSTGSTITETDLLGNVIRTFAGPGPFTEGVDFPTIQTSTSVPEPTSVALLSLGLLGMAMRRRSKV